MKRREFITLLGSAAAWPIGATAQQRSTLPQVGILDAGDQGDPEQLRRIGAFEQRLGELGWTHDHTVKVVRRWNATEKAASELVALKPDAIFAQGTPSVAALQHETRTVPIVFANVSDPVAAGFVSSLARPGGNITGFTNFEYLTSGKWLELLKEIAPEVVRVGVLVDPQNPQSPGRLRVLFQTAPALSLQIVPLEVRNRPDIENRLADFARDRPAGGVLVPPGSLPNKYRDVIISAANGHRLPCVHSNSVFARSGGLLSYGVDAIDECRQAATYVHRILQGEKPADLPVQAPTKFELVVNLKTAKGIGLSIPATLLARADEVIE